MPIPAQVDTPWSSLDTDAKRRRLLAAAEAVFARDGMDAPVPAIAEAAGAGVGSVYRLFESKDELIAALAAERVSWFAAQAQAALGEPDPGAALMTLLARIVERDVADPVLAVALKEVLRERAEMAPVRAEAAAALNRLISRAIAAGAVRDDLTNEDIAAVLAGVRAAEMARPGTGERLLKIALDGIRTR
jgi:AcrR family transcriptional regulator